MATEHHGWMEKARQGVELTMEERVERLEYLLARVARHTPNLPINRDEPGGFQELLQAGDP